MKCLVHIPFWFKKVLLLTFGVFLLPASCFLYPLSKFLRIRSKGPCLYIFYRSVFYFYMRFCSNIFNFVHIYDIIFNTILFPPFFLITRRQTGKFLYRFYHPTFSYEYQVCTLRCGAVSPLVSLYHTYPVSCSTVS